MREDSCGAPTRARPAMIPRLNGRNPQRPISKPPRPEKSCHEHYEAAKHHRVVTESHEHSVESARGLRPLPLTIAMPVDCDPKPELRVPKMSSTPPLVDAVLGLSAELRARMDAVEERIVAACDRLDKRSQERWGGCETRLAHCTEMLEGLAEGMVTAQTSAMEARRPHGAKAKAVVSVAVEAEPRRSADAAQEDDGRHGASSSERRGTDAAQEGQEKGPSERRQEGGSAADMGNEVSIGSPDNVVAAGLLVVGAEAQGRVDPKPKDSPGEQSRRLHKDKAPSPPDEPDDVWEEAAIFQKHDFSDGSSAGSSTSHRRKSFVGRAAHNYTQVCREIFGRPDPDHLFTRILRSNWFVGAGGLVTIANCVAIAIDTELAAMDAFNAAQGLPPNEHFVNPIALSVFQRLFFVWLAMEIVICVLGSRSEFFVGKDLGWNMFDMVLFGATLIAQLSTQQNSSYIRVLRVGRSMRSVFAVRTVRYSEGLQRMTRGMVHVVLSLIWAAILCFVLIFIFGLAMMEGVINFIAGGGDGVISVMNDNSLGIGVMYPKTNFASHEGLEWFQAMQSYYGGVGRTWMTLFRGLMGADWGPFAAPLAAINPVWGAAWALFIALGMLGLFNVLNGVVVDIVRRPLPTDRAVGIMEEELEERAVAALFREELARLRKDTDGALSERNFTNFVSRPAVRAKLADFGIDLDHIDDLFYVVDTEHAGAVTADEAARRFMLLRGDAKSRDVARLGRDLMQLQRELMRFKKSVEEVRTAGMLAAHGERVETVKM